MSVRSQAVIQTATEKPDTNADFLDQLGTSWKAQRQHIFEIIIIERFACTDFFDNDISCISFRERQIIGNVQKNKPSSTLICFE